MKRCAALTGLALAFALCVSAEVPPPPDELSIAYDAAVSDLLAGVDRQEIVDRLGPVVETSKSPYRELARMFLEDLAASAANPPALAETRIDFPLVAESGNRRSLSCRLAQDLSRDPGDPVYRLLTGDRNIIAELIPLLEDRTPLRSSPEVFFKSPWPEPQPRVCDMALAIIEFHALSRFRDTEYGGTRLLHQLPEEQRQRIDRRIAAWWEENKDKPVSAGLRAQIEYTESIEQKIRMADTLIRLARQEKTGDEEFGLGVLREILRVQRSSSMGLNAAHALARFGDTSAVDLFYEDWKSESVRRDSGVAFYLCRYGGRREWELLHAISQNEIAAGRQPGSGAVWSYVLSSGVAGTNRHAIPILGLALTQTTPTGSRFVEGADTDNQSFSQADLAVEALQKQLGKDFGYRPGDPMEERLRAIRAARAWWEGEGKPYHTLAFLDRK